MKLPFFAKNNENTHHTSMEDDELSTRMAIYTETEETIRIPSSILPVIQEVPRIHLDIRHDFEEETKNGVTAISAQGAYTSFAGLEELLIMLEVPFIHTSIRNMTQHDVRIYIPAYDGKQPTNKLMPCNDEGQPFYTIAEMLTILDSLGEKGLAKAVRDRKNLVDLDIAAWNNRINADEKAEKLNRIYVTVRAFNEIRKQRPEISTQLCYAYANCMAHLTDEYFSLGFGYPGPSARELALDTAISEGKYTRGGMSYELARITLDDPNGYIFGPLTVEMKGYISNQISAEDCPKDSKSVTTISKKLH